MPTTAAEPQPAPGNGLLQALQDLPAQPLGALLAQLAACLPPLPQAPDWERHRAWRWVRRGQHAQLEAFPHTQSLQLADLQGIEAQRTRFDRNIRQFVAGWPANHVLLTGARGCGKSSLVKAALTEYAAQGLRVVEVDRNGLADLPDILALLRDRPERFLLFCDDLSFDGAEHGWTALKSLLDGSVAAHAGNVLVVATSNRRHLMPDLQRDNQDTRFEGEEIHPGEAIEEKISLSDRFGLWLSFYPLDQATYLAIAAHWARSLGFPPPADDAVFRNEALQWALSRSSRSGRSAWQFARDWAGRQGLGQ